jgi:carbonic anhydrase
MGKLVGEGHPPFLSTESSTESRMTERESETHAAADKAWSYDGETGPAQWASLSDEYALCDRGRAQSPIDVPADAEPADRLGALQTNYSASPAQVDPGQLVTHVDLEAGGPLTFQGTSYELVQFHFHTPSEHTIGGQSFAAEAHLVHESEGGELAVVGVMVEEGAEHAALEDVLSGAVQRGDGAPFDAAQLLPEEEAYYTYTGSLTTPPCSEGVRWVLMQQPIEASPGQVDRLKGEQTNRPVQPLNGRAVAASE